MSSQRQALLLLNGVLSEPALVRRLARTCLLVCADGGARHARALGLVPDVVAGDMDSLPRSLPRSWGRTNFVCDFDENSSDFEKALCFLAKAGSQRVYVAGLFGGRLDHCLVNLALARRFGRALRLVLVDRGMAMLLGPGRHRLSLKRGQLFSVLAEADAANVSISGSRYALKRQKLLPGGRGLSNKALGPVTLTVHSGLVWAMAPKEFKFS